MTNPFYLYYTKNATNRWCIRNGGIYQRFEEFHVVTILSDMVVFVIIDNCLCGNGSKLKN